MYYLEFSLSWDYWTSSTKWSRIFLNEDILYFKYLHHILLVNYWYVHPNYHWLIISGNYFIGFWIFVFDVKRTSPKTCAKDTVWRQWGFSWRCVCFLFHNFLTSLLPSIHCMNGIYYIKRRLKWLIPRSQLSCWIYFFRLLRNTIFLKAETLPARAWAPKA